MITTRRSTNESSEGFYGSERGNVAVLDRESRKTYAEHNSTSTVEDDYQKAKQRTKENLEKLLNYDRVPQQPVQETSYVVEDNAKTNINEDDVRPSSTTMQFGDEDVTTMLNELQSDEKSDLEFKQSKKNKVAIALYAVCVTVVLALIILNTGIIAVLTSQNEAKMAELDSAISEYNQAVNDFNRATSEENIINVAENVYNMIKG